MNSNAIERIADRLFRSIYGEGYSQALSPKILENFIKDRLTKLELNSYLEYFEYLNKSSEERELLLSELTIHTTYWFREPAHFKRVKQLAMDTKPGKTLKVLCLGCSTGEEVYSLGLTLESIRSVRPSFDYTIDGIDLDYHTILKAKEGRYPAKGVERIPEMYQGLLAVDGDKFSVKKTIKGKTNFYVGDAQSFSLKKKDYDLVFCRNLLIYFSPKRAKDIFYRCLDHLSPGGHIVIGHCDSIQGIGNEKRVKQLGNSIFHLNHSSENKSEEKVSEKTYQQKKILVLDDQPDVCETIEIHLEEKGDYQILKALSVFEARKILKENRIDVIVSDYDLGDDNGLDFARDLEKHRSQIPIILISGVVTDKILDEANSDNIVDFFEKPLDYDSLHSSIVTYLDISERKEKTKASFTERSKGHPKIPEAILIGVSTGGPIALRELFAHFPGSMPPIIVVQHIDDKFAPNFSTHIIKGSGLNLVKTRENGRIHLKRGDIVFTEGDYHLAVGADETGFFVKRDHSEKFSGFRPSVDILFQSAAKIDCKVRLTAIVLTGMGRDGAFGMRILKERKRSYHIAQSEESCVVYGMPKRAVETGTVDFVGNIQEIKEKLYHRFAISGSENELKKSS